MNARALESAILATGSRARWVDALTGYFAAHDLFYGHGTATAADEAYWLVWQLCGQPDRLDDAPTAEPDTTAADLDAALAREILTLARRRVEERMPLAYLLGSAWFAGLEFEVSPAVLIPRSPLAELIEQGFAPWLALDQGDRLLDVGTGSGCIAIAAAVHLPGLRVDATEIDPAALAIAQSNRARHGLGARLQLIEADLWPRGDARYRVIMSNPPYVPTAVVAALPAEYRHEPPAALDGGRDGLDPARRLLAGAAERLTDDGVLIVEVGESAAALEAAFPEVPWTWLEFERGGEGVFLLTVDELRDGWG